MSDGTSNADQSALSRRTLLKGAAAGAGVAVGSGAVTGFPTIWAQNVKDVTLVHIGGSYAAIKEIGEQAKKDLGFTIEIQAVDPGTQLTRALTQPKSLDINNVDATQLPFLAGKGVLKPVHVKDYKLWDKTVPIFTTGKFPDGREVSEPGLLAGEGWVLGRAGRQEACGQADRLPDHGAHACSTPIRSASAPISLADVRT